MSYVMSLFGVSIIVAFTSIVLEKRWPGLSKVVLLTGAVWIITSAMGKIISVVDFAIGMGENFGAGQEYIKAMLQVSAIAIVLKLLLSFLSDTGSESLKFAVELGGRVCILLVALPFIVQAIDVLSELLRG